MDVAQDLRYYFTLYLFQAINDSIIRLMMPTESIILLKNHVSCNFMLKYYITVSLRQFTKTSNQFLLIQGNENLEICMPV